MNHTRKHKKILIAPLNWGLGHASRCIPIIQALIDDGFEPILSGDGASLELLKQEFPELVSYELPSTEVSYSENGNLLRFKLLMQVPKLLNAVAQERKVIEDIHKKEGLSGIISDNRFGVRLDEIPSIYITHQLNVLSGRTSALSTRLHHQVIQKFHECWVPDFETNELAGALSSYRQEPARKFHENKKANTLIKYVGPLSRFSAHPQQKKWSILAILSGPEPQRKLLENKLLHELKSHAGKSMIIQGLVGPKQKSVIHGKTTLVNYLLANELRDVIEQSDLILSRSGYSSIMDLYTLQARAFFIPTPGQFEQEYLATHHKESGNATFCKQSEFQLSRLFDTEGFEGFKHKKTPNKQLQRSLFGVFK